MFEKALRENRHKLLELGFPLSTINSWIYSLRRPTIENALVLSGTLNLPLNKIPYRQVIINEP